LLIHIRPSENLVAEALEMPTRIGVLGIPFNVGWQGEGIAEAPRALRAAGLVSQLASTGLEVKDFGDVECKLPARDSSNPKLLNSAQVIELSKAIAPRVEQCVRPGFFPIILGGEDGILMGLIAGLQRGLPRRIGLIYLDAHGDFNTPETTPSGLIGGMNVAIVAGHGPPELTSIFGRQPQLPEDAIVFYGSRDLDPPEKVALEKSRTKVLMMDQVKRLGAAQAMKEAIEFLKPKVDSVYFHMDVDVLDPKEMSALILPVANGLTLKECESALQTVTRSGMLCGAAFMVFDARKDPTRSEAPKIVQLIKGLAQTLAYMPT
jgi:arginase